MSRTKRNSDHPVLLDLPAAGACLSVGETKVRELITRGELEAVVLDGRLRVPLPALDDLVARLPRAARATN